MEKFKNIMAAIQAFEAKLMSYGKITPENIDAYAADRAAYNLRVFRKLTGSDIKQIDVTKVSVKFHHKPANDIEFEELSQSLKRVAAYEAANMDPSIHYDKELIAAPDKASVKNLQAIMNSWATTFFDGSDLMMVKIYMAKVRKIVRTRTIIIVVSAVVVAAVAAIVGYNLYKRYRLTADGLIEEDPDRNIDLNMDNIEVREIPRDI